MQGLQILITLLRLHLDQTLHKVKAVSIGLQVDEIATSLWQGSQESMVWCDTTDSHSCWWRRCSNSYRLIPTLLVRKSWDEMHSHLRMQPEFEVAVYKWLK